MQFFINFSSPFLLSLFFGLGVVLQAYFLVSHKVNLKSFGLLVLACSGMSFLFSLRVFLKTLKAPEDIYFAIFLFFILFSIFFAIISKKEILPEISEKTILCFTLVFWYIFLNYFRPTITDFWFWLALIPSLGTVIISFVDIKLGFFWKLFFYTWFLLMVIFFNIFYFSFGNLSFFFDPKGIKPFSPFEILTTGMAFLYLVSHIWYVIELLPLKGSTFKETIQEWKEQAQLLTGKYSDAQLTPLHAFFIIFFIGGVLSLNYFFKITSDDLVISLSVLVIPQLISYRGRRKKKLASS